MKIEMKMDIDIDKKKYHKTRTEFSFSQDRTAGTGHLGQDSRDRASESGQPCQDSWEG
jgi:hypothetical protein